MRVRVVTVAGSRCMWSMVQDCCGMVDCGSSIAVVGLRLHRIGFLMEFGGVRIRSGGRVAGFFGCLAKFGVARPRFVVLTRRSVTEVD